MNLSLNRCPTCLQKQSEIAPGIWDWPESTYRLDGEEHSCDCEWQDNLRRRYLLAHIPVDYWTLSRDDYFGDPNALEATDEYITNWPTWRLHGRGIQFYSPTQGTGKTMLATLIAKKLIQRGESVFFITFRDAVRLYDIPYEDRIDKVNRLRNTPVLVLDEVTRGYSDRQRDYFATELEDLIRFRTAGNGVTIMTTNLTQDELDTAYSRIFSLLSEKQQFVHVDGPDRRRSGDTECWREQFILNGEARPIR